MLWVFLFFYTCNKEFSDDYKSQFHEPQDCCKMLLLLKTTWDFVLFPEGQRTPVVLCVWHIALFCSDSITINGWFVYILKRKTFSETLCIRTLCNNPHLFIPAIVNQVRHVCLFLCVTETLSFVFDKRNITKIISNGNIAHPLLQDCRRFFAMYALVTWLMTVMVERAGHSTVMYHMVPPTLDVNQAEQMPRNTLVLPSR